MGGSSSTVFGLLLFCECGFPPGSPVSTLITIQFNLNQGEAEVNFNSADRKDVVFPPGQLRFSTKQIIIFKAQFFEVIEKIWFFLRVNSGFPSTFYLNL